MIPIRQIENNSQRKRSQPKGRQLEPVALAQIQELLGKADIKKDMLIEYLHLIQDKYKGLKLAHLNALASIMHLSAAEVYEVASFYHHFDVIRDGDAATAEITVRVCTSLSCQMQGAQNLLQQLPRLLGNTVRVLETPCIGRCEKAPAVSIDQQTLSDASAEKIAEALATKSGFDDIPTAIEYANYKNAGGYQQLIRCHTEQLSKEAVFTMLDNAGLRGLGGAGFPAGRKWRIVAAEPAPRLMAVNIDEGEPGTFKDRHYLERDPHLFLEGMLIAAWAVDVAEIYIYLRDEYQACHQLLRREIAQLQAQPPIPNLPRIYLRRGAGAYICGEESAMIESIEGKRGMPRLRPPYVAQQGLFGRPTLEHNFETLYWIRDFLEKGTDWFVHQGRHGRHGLRSFSVSGRVKRPGVHLAPAGITVQELINEYCGGMQDGHQLYAYLPGGASGGILPASLDNLPLDFDTLQPYGCFIGSAAIIILSDQDSAVAAARNMMRFFRDESCGQCTPCRVGTAKALALIDKEQWDIPLLQELLHVMRDASICGLGQAAPNPVECVIRYFPHELDTSRSAT
ncbi:MAG: NAD(P)H-dependent oxidoreductase subunit E [Burkholderiales bacterium]|nr:NAD(P)H-dependent oxidoreductase subunit E [Burkholderiales bacterium]